MKKITTFLFGIFCMLSTVNAQDITVFDFDGVTPTFSSWSDTFTSAANPLSDAVNSSANAGEYTHSNIWSDVSTTVSIDPRLYTSFEVSVYIPTSTTGSVVIACYDASNKQLDWYSQPITTAGVWTKYTRNLNFTSNIASVVVGFNFGTNPNGNTDDVVYVDNLIFKKSANPFLALYAETFYASWSQWGSWTGAPSTQAGNWFGGINLQTDGDANITLVRDWDDHEHKLVIAPTDAAVIIPDINVAGFDSLKFSADLQWPFNKTDSAAFSTATDEQKKPVVEMKVGTGDWVSVPTSAISENWANQVVLLKDAAGNPISNVSAISLRLSHTSLVSAAFDNVKIFGKSIQTGLFNPSFDAFSVYPNPATNYILVQNAQKVSILDLNGRVVKEAYNTEKVDVSSLAKGAYIVKAQVENATKIGKLIKE
jgi:hypothetical protein